MRAVGSMRRFEGEVGGWRSGEPLTGGSAKTLLGGAVARPSVTRLGRPLRREPDPGGLHPPPRNAGHSRTCPELRAVHAAMRVRTRVRRADRRAREMAEVRARLAAKERRKEERKARKAAELAAPNPLAPPLNEHDHPPAPGADEDEATPRTRQRREMLSTKHDMLMGWEEWMRSRSAMQTQAVSASERRRLRRMFDMIDTDKSNSIEIHEVQDAMALVGIDVPMHELVQRMKVIDCNYDGQISFNEFCLGMASVSEWDLLLATRRRRQEYHLRQRHKLSRLAEAAERARPGGDTARGLRAKATAAARSAEAPDSSIEVPFSLWVPAFHRKRMVHGISEEGSAFLAPLESAPKTGKAARRWGERRKRGGSGAKAGKGAEVEDESEDESEEDESEDGSENESEDGLEGGKSAGAARAAHPERNIKIVPAPAGADDAEGQLLPGLARQASAPAGEPPRPVCPLPLPRQSSAPPGVAPLELPSPRVLSRRRRAGSTSSTPRGGEAARPHTTAPDGSLLLVTHWQRTLEEVRTRHCAGRRGRRRKAQQQQKQQ